MPTNRPELSVIRIVEGQSGRSRVRMELTICFDYGLAGSPGSERVLVLGLERSPPMPGAVREVVGIGRGAFSGNMKVSFQAARSIG